MSGAQECQPLGFQATADFTHRLNSWAYAIRFAALRTTDPWCDRTMAISPVRTAGSIFG